MSRLNIVLLGDSITQFSFSVDQGGWGAALADWYSRKADVINRGFSGYNSSWILTMLPNLFPREMPPISLVTVFLGANDSVSESSDQHVPLALYRSNLIAIVEYITALHPSAHILLITPPRVNSELWPSRSIEQVSRYADVVRELCTSSTISGTSSSDVPSTSTSTITSSTAPHLHLVDLWTGKYNINPSPDAGDLVDGLHLARGGNKKVFGAIRNVIRRLCAEINPDQPSTDGGSAEPVLPMHFPHWSVLANKSPAEVNEILSAWK